MPVEVKQPLAGLQQRHAVLRPVHGLARNALDVPHTPRLLAQHALDEHRVGARTGVGLQQRGLGVLEAHVVDDHALAGVADDLVRRQAMRGQCREPSEAVELCFGFSGRRDVPNPHGEHRSPFAFGSLRLQTGVHARRVDGTGMRECVIDGVLEQLPAFEGVGFVLIINVTKARVLLFRTRVDQDLVALGVRVGVLDK